MERTENTNRNTMIEGYVLYLACTSKVDVISWNTSFLEIHLNSQWTF